jgi:hypothetical protein
MRCNLPVEDNALFEQIKDFFDARSCQTDERTTCPVCGEARRFFQATLWLDGTDLQWNLRVPVCSCDSAASKH